MKFFKPALAEFTGTAMLLCAVIGSGIMAEHLSGGNVALALLANTLATVFALYVLIEVLGSTSGAHFNPVVTLVMWWRRALQAPVLEKWRGEGANTAVAQQALLKRARLNSAARDGKYTLAMEQ